VEDSQTAPGPGIDRLRTEPEARLEYLLANDVLREHDDGTISATGEFDDARTSGGTTKAQKDRIQTVESIIRDVAKEYDAGAPIDVVLERAEDRGISDDKTEHEIQKLRENGKVYEPRTDHLRPSS